MVLDPPTLVRLVSDPRWSLEANCGRRDVSSVPTARARKRREGGKQRENDATNFSDCIPGQKSRYPDYALTQNGRGHTATRSPAIIGFGRSRDRRRRSLLPPSFPPSLFSPFFLAGKTDGNESEVGLRSELRRRTHECCGGGEEHEGASK